MKSGNLHSVPHGRGKTRYRIDVSYDGADYAGWQVQPNGVTIQQKLEEAIRVLTGEPAKVHGSGRTDQGVHARKQVAHFDLGARLPLKAIVRGLNGLLPCDIRIMAAKYTAPDFHARRSAVSKEYRYFIWNGEAMPAYMCRYRLPVRKRLDVAMMRVAAAHLVGRHDFAAFSANSNREIDSTVREVTALKVLKRGAEIVIVARGEGFLYRMVRSIAGLLLRVGEGAESPDAAASILASKVRTARVPTAQPQGLFLWNVEY